MESVVERMAQRLVAKRCTGTGPILRQRIAYTNAPLVNFR